MDFCRVNAFNIIFSVINVQKSNTPMTMTLIIQQFLIYEYIYTAKQSLLTLKNYIKFLAFEGKSGVFCANILHINIPILVNIMTIQITQTFNTMHTTYNQVHY